MLRGQNPCLAHCALALLIQISVLVVVESRMWLLIFPEVCHRYWYLGSLLARERLPFLELFLRQALSRCISRCFSFYQELLMR